MITFTQQLFYQATGTHWIIVYVSPTNIPFPCLVTIVTELHIRTYKCPQLQAKYSDFNPENGVKYYSETSESAYSTMRCHNKDDYICKNHCPENVETHDKKNVIYTLPVPCINRMETLSVRSEVPTAVQVTGY
jgi:hypothetical protein